MACLLYEETTRPLPHQYDTILCPTEDVVAPVARIAGKQLAGTAIGVIIPRHGNRYVLIPCNQGLVVNGCCLTKGSLKILRHGDHISIADRSAFFCHPTQVCRPMQCVPTTMCFCETRPLTSVRVA